MKSLKKYSKYSKILTSKFQVLQTGKHSIQLSIVHEIVNIVSRLFQYVMYEFPPVNIEELILKKESRGVKSSDPAGHSLAPLLSDHLSENRSFNQFRTGAT